MEIKLQKSSNSYPSTVLKTLRIEKKKNRKISLAERFKEYKGETEASAFVWDNPIGREIW